MTFFATQIFVFFPKFFDSFVGLTDDSIHKTDVFCNFRGDCHKILDIVNRWSYYLIIIFTFDRFIQQKPTFRRCGIYRSWQATSFNLSNLHYPFYVVATFAYNETFKSDFNTSVLSDLLYKILDFLSKFIAYYLLQDNLQFVGGQDILDKFCSMKCTYYCITSIILPFIQTNIFLIEHNF